MPVRVLYDWYGSKATPRSLWRELRDGGVDVRAFGAFSLGAPLEAFLRDHRKSLRVDGEYASVGGICIADQGMERSPDTGLPYRDTAVGFRGPVVADLERAFRDVWNRSGPALPAQECPRAEEMALAGEEATRVVIQEPGKMRVARMLQLLTACARERIRIAVRHAVRGRSRAVLAAVAPPELGSCGRHVRAAVWSMLARSPSGAACPLRSAADRLRVCGASGQHDAPAPPLGRLPRLARARSAAPYAVRSVVAPRRRNRVVDGRPCRGRPGSRGCYGTRSRRRPP